jgi:hypothetical protein
MNLPGRIGRVVIARMNKRATVPLPASLAGFTPMELNERLTLYEAAKLNKFKDPGSFEENYPHLVKRIGKRKKFMTRYDALVLPPAPPGWKPEEPAKASKK